MIQNIVGMNLNNTGLKSTPANWMARIISILIVLLPIFLAGVYIILYSENVPSGHDWISFSIFQDSHNAGQLIHNMWQPLNGARAFFPQLIYYLDFKLFGFNTRHMLFLTLLCMALSVLCLWKLFKKDFEYKIIAFAPVTWLWFSLIQYKDFLTGWHFLIHLSIMCSVWAFYFLNKNKFNAIIVALLFYCAAFYSFGSGLMIYPAGLFFLMLVKAPPKNLLLWIIGGGAITFFWFIGFKSGNTIEPGSILNDVFSSIKLFLILMANPFTGLFGYFGSLGVWVNTLVGLLLFGYLLTILYHNLHHFNGFWNMNWTLLLFSLFIFALIVFGRVQRGVEVGTAYMTVPIAFAVFLYILSDRSIHFSHQRAAFVKMQKVLYLILTISIIMSAVIGDIYGFYWGPLVKGERIKQRYSILNYREQTSIINEYQDNTFEMRSLCAFLENNKKSVFIKSSNEDMFLHVFRLDKFKDHSVSYTYADSKAISEILIVPVNHIKSIGILAHCFYPDIKDTLKISLGLHEKSNELVNCNIPAHNIYRDGRAYFEINNLNVLKGDSLFITIKHVVDEIKLPLYKNYPGSPKQLSINGDKLSDRSISIELNPPQALNGYYKQLVLRAKLKDIRSRLSKLL